MKQLNHSCSQSANQVFPFIADIQKFVSIHPVLFKADEIKPNYFLLHERLNKHLPFSFSYYVTMVEIIPNQKVVMHSNIFKLVDLTLTFKFNYNEQTQLTEVTEYINIKAPALIKYQFTKMISKIHVQLFSIINKTLADN
ncbi:MAG: hypothetical protein V4620_05100 [Bacteroidota bacterium]